MPSRNAIEVRPVRRIDVGGPPPEFDPAGAGPGGNPSARLLSQLLEHKWLMLVTFVLVGAIAFSGVWFGVAPTYRATARIEVSPVIPQLLEGKSDMVPMYESYRASQVDHLTGTEVIDAVLDLASVRDTAFYRDEPATEVERILNSLKLRPQEPVKDRLLAALEAKAPKGTQHIFVTMDAHRAGEARLIVDAVVSAYVELVNKRELAADDDKLKIYEKQIREAEGELKTKETSAQELRQRLRTGSPEEVLNQRLVRIEALLARLAELNRQIDLNSAASTSQPASQPAPSTPDDAVVTVDPLLRSKDAEMQRLEAEFAKARSELAAAPDRLGPLNPTLERLKKNVESVQERIREREAALASMALGTAPDGSVGVGSTFAALKAEAARLDVDTKKELADYDQAFNDAERLSEINRESVALEEKLRTFRANAEHINLNRQVAGKVRSFLAYEPSQPVEDKRVKFGAAAVFGAAAAAVALAFLRVRMTTHVRDTEVELGFSAGRILGRLPLRRGELSRVVAEPEYAEPLRVVRTTLLHALQAEHGKVVQITSAEPSSGKTTVATQLARSTALVGKRVLLVDADLYRASLSKRSDAAARGGLMLALETGEWRPEVIHDPDIETLALLPVGRCTTDRQAELLANGRLRRLIDEWRKEYDFIVIDSPPLLGPADSLILSGAVDGTIMIVRERHCRLQAVRGAMSAIESAGGRLLGTVVIGNPKKSHPYYASYQYTYGYGGYYRRHSGSEGESPKDKN
ncbi:MAG: AAA family ATPase [Phycisphaerales bacterium]|nr:AAA family ATPase [Phycisphaerales bacterium]